MTDSPRTIEQLLATSEPFKSLNPSDRRALASASRQTHYAKGETVFREGQPAEAVCIVKEGRVHLMKFLEGGQTSTTCVMAGGDTFCCLPALDRQPYPADAVAAVDSVIVRIPISAFHDLLQRNPAFLQRSLCLFCERLRQVEHRSCRVYDSVERRLAQALLTLAKKFGSTIPLTKHELAELANTTVETTIRVLSQLKKRGILKSSRGSTTITKPDQLQRLASS